MKGGDGSWGQTVKAKASLDGGDGALNVCCVQQLGKLEQAMAQHEELWRETKNSGGEKN